MQYQSGKPRVQKWYNHNLFPLIPCIEVRKEDSRNTWNMSFRWLFFTIWTLDSFQFELAIVADTHWGVGIIGVLPYLRWVCTVPCPEFITFFVQKNLNRGFNKIH